MPLRDSSTSFALPTSWRLAIWLLPLAYAVLISGASAQQRQVMLPEETLDQWIFGSGNDARTARQSLERRLMLRIVEIQPLCRLTDSQAEKLRLAGMGDIKHFFNRVDASKRKLMQLTDENAVGMAFQDIQPLQQEFTTGLITETSLFSKMLRRLLSEDQATLYKQHEYERHKARYVARARFALLQLENSVPLLHEQRQQLLAIVAEDTPPPNRLGQHDLHYILQQLSLLPPDKLRPIFDDLQWQAFQQHLKQAEAFIPFLRGSGIVPFDSPEAGTDTPEEAPQLIPALQP